MEYSDNEYKQWVKRIEQSSLDYYENKLKIAKQCLIEAIPYIKNTYDTAEARHDNQNSDGAQYQIMQDADNLLKRIKELL